MRLSEVSWAESELPADSLAAGDRLPAGDRDRPVNTLAHQPDLVSGPRPDWPGRDRPDGSRGLAERLARLPDAHPSAWSSDARFATGRAGPRTGGDQGSADSWWRGESDIWWRAGSAGEADYDDDSGSLDAPGELADCDDLTDADGPAEADWAADGEDAGDFDGQGSGTGRTGARAARPGPAAHGRWGGAGWAGPDQSGPDRGHYRPWFSADGSWEPWFAAGPEDWADS